MCAVVEQAMSGRPLAECHGSKASLWQASTAAGARRSLTLPLHDEAMVSPISAVPWAVTLWRDLPEEVLLAATEHLHSCVVHAGVSKEGHVAWFATWGAGAAQPRRCCRVAWAPPTLSDPGGGQGACTSAGKEAQEVDPRERRGQRRLSPAGRGVGTARTAGARASRRPRSMPNIAH
jgi:hypothetical protein